MIIDVVEFIDQAYDKFEEIKNKWIDTIDFNKHDSFSGYDVKYGKDISILFSDKSMFSSSVLRHIDANKCLFTVLKNRLLAKTKSQDYTLYYYDRDDKLILSEFVVDAFCKQRTYYMSNNIESVQISYFIMSTEYGQQKRYFDSVEYAVYDNNHRIIKCETYVNQSKQPYGVSVSGEYYMYEHNEGKLIKAVKYEDYNQNFMKNEIMRTLCPDLIINPYVYEYDFEYDQNHIFCQKVRKYSSNENKIDRYELHRDELIKLRNNGVNCFGV